ncbi:hypothetical protein K1T71_004269 [Dendrolimus kikuchii]|uniref:Uncharacterized protein n=1 Tax=Dendrolimus kikuchii TaxID=765133 RepID=A0ACC1D6Y8_9NEOP|nr:hypothetical protein K1T71_004269 [Dendrolimus kikuchii]
MKIIVKKLQGEECTLEVLPTTCILEIKHHIAKVFKISPEEQKLLFLGRTLLDDQIIQNYPNIKNGSKLNLVVKKRDGLYEASIKHFKMCGMTESEAQTAAKRLLIVVQEKFNKMSWDDIERLAQDCIIDRTSEKLSQRTLSED